MAAMPSQLSEIQICDKSGFGMGGGGGLVGRALSATLVGKVHWPCSASGQ